jgi:hypothetical protein
MARRPRPPDEVLSRKDLVELQSRLSMTGTSALQDFYRAHTSFAGSDPGTSLAPRRFKSGSPPGNTSGNGGSIGGTGCGEDFPPDLRLRLVE